MAYFYLQVNNNQDVDNKRTFLSIRMIKSSEQYGEQEQSQVHLKQKEAGFRPEQLTSRTGTSTQSAREAGVTDSAYPRPLDSKVPRCRTRSQKHRRTATRS